MPRCEPRPCDSKAQVLGHCDVGSYPGRVNNPFSLESQGLSHLLCLIVSGPNPLWYFRPSLARNEMALGAEYAGYNLA